MKLRRLLKTSIVLKLAFDNILSFELIIEEKLSARENLYRFIDSVIFFSFSRNLLFREARDVIKTYRSNISEIIENRSLFGVELLNIKLFKLIIDEIIRDINRKL